MVHRLEAVNNWLQMFFKVSIGSILVLVVQKAYQLLSKMYGQTKQEDMSRDADIALLKNAILAQLHDTIYRLTEEYIERGYITLDELDNLEYIYQSYQALGGNGSGEYRFLKVKELTIKAGSDPALDKLIRQGGEMNE